MKHIKTLKGSGTATSTKGKTSVEYNLEVWEKQIPTPLMDNPNASVPGLQQIRGKIRPVCCAVGEVASLQMHDGEILKFFYTDLSGTIAISG